jgi:serine-type D-Ala-D-Ala carboxypeptidase (penicillin-binding protein 5/6)
MRLTCRSTAVVMICIFCALVAVPVQVRAEAPDEPAIVAESAIVVDASTGEVLYDHAADDVRPMASLTKLFTAFVAMEIAPLDLPMTVDEVDLVGEASMGLEAGDTLTLLTLLHGTLLPSGNDAASVIARNAGGGSQQRFLEHANNRINEMGLTSTHLANPHGLDADGHHSTARDIATLTMHMLATNSRFAAIISTPSFSGDGYTVYNTNRLLNAYEGLIGGKTGVTDAAGYCLMQIAERDGHVVITVLLGSTSGSWYADAERLLDYGFANITVPDHTADQAEITVTGLDAGSAIVTLTTLTSDRTWSPWFWVVAILALVPASIIIVLQVQRLLALIAFGVPRYASPSLRHRAGQNAVHVGPRPSLAVGSQRATYLTSSDMGLDLLAFDHWQDRIDSDSRERERVPAVFVTPSFTGD